MASISTSTMVAMAVMAAVSAASTSASIMAQEAQADAQETAAKNAAASDYLQQTEAQEQVDQQASIEKSERAKQAMIERASLRVAQGESGLAGLTPLKEQGAIDFNQSYDTSIMEANRSNKIRQLQVEKEGTYANAQGRINMANASRTSGFGAGLQIGSSTVQGAAQGYGFAKSMGWKG